MSNHLTWECEFVWTYFSNILTNCTWNNFDVYNSETLWRANLMVISWKCNLVWKCDDRICTQRWDSTLYKLGVGPRAYSASPNKFKDWTGGNIIRLSRVVLVFDSAGRTGFPIPVRVKDFCLLQKVQTGSGAQPAYYSVGVGDPS